MNELKERRFSFHQSSSGPWLCGPVTRRASDVQNVIQEIVRREVQMTAQGAARGAAHHAVTARILDRTLSPIAG